MNAIGTHIRANVVGYVALFFALSLGTAYAIDKNAIKSKHIGAGQVKESDLGNGAVTGDKLAANSVDGDNVVDNSLKGADVDEGSLNLPQQSIPSSLPPSGPAGGDLAGEYPSPQVSESGLTAGGDIGGPLSNAQLGGNSVGTNEVDGTLTGADIADTGGSDNVNADSVDGVQAGDLPRRDASHSSIGDTGASFFRYFLNTGLATTFEFGLIELRTTATPGQIMVCSNTSTPQPYVIYVNGTRTTHPGDSNAACNDVFTPGSTGDFQIHGAETVVFGSPNDAGGSTDDYHVIGFR